MADIPPEVRRGLNEGRIEVANLVEWLAIDLALLMAHVLPQVGLRAEAAAVTGAARAAAEEGVTVRIKKVAAALQAALAARRDAAAVFEALATHPSDMVRSLAAYALSADPSLDLKQRLARAQRFAADRSMGVRECAWDSFRPHLARELDRGLKLLRPWVRHAHEGVRRCAVEGTRPRGVWTAHLEALKREPERALPLLEPVRSDPSRYVQRAVANWLNDASKSEPRWVRAVLARWNEESPTPETAWIAHHAARTMRKAR